MSSLVEQVKLKNINSDAELISNLISLEILTGEKIRVKDLYYFMEPFRIIRLMKLIPWEDSQLLVN